MEKVVLFLHGFKRKQHQEYGAFFEYLEKNNIAKKYEYLPEEDYYDNHDRSTLSWKKFDAEVEKMIKKHQDKEIIIIGYSMGAIAGLSMAARHKNVTSVFAMYPAFYISFTGWITALRDNITKAKEMKKRLGPERYKRIKELQTKGLAEKYPIQLTLAMNSYRKKPIKYLSKIKNKNIRIVWSHKDETTQNRKTLKMLHNKIDLRLNNIEIIEVFESHYSALDRGRDRVFKDIVNFINKQ